MLRLPEFANPVLSEKEAKAIFMPHLDKLRKVMNDTWREWESCPQRHALDARARATFISSVFRHFAKGAFAGDNAVSFSERGNSFFLYFGNDAKARLKKLRSNGSYSNIMTGRQLRLLKQMDIPGFLPGTYLTIGYQLDDSQQKMQHKKITLQSLRGVVYSIDIDEAASSSGATPAIVMPQPSPQSGAPRARAKRGAVSDRKKRSGLRE